MTEDTDSSLRFDKKFGYAHILSIIALVISVGTPFLTYLYLAPKLEENKNKIAELKNRPQLISSVVELSDKSDNKWLAFEIRNVGEYPAKELQIIIASTAKDSLSKSTDRELALRQHVQLAPALEHNIKLEDDIIRLTLLRPLAPANNLYVNLREMPRSINMQNQYGEFIPIYSKGSGGGGGPW